VDIVGPLVVGGRKKTRTGFSEKSSIPNYLLCRHTIHWNITIKPEPPRRITEPSSKLGLRFETYSPFGRDILVDAKKRRGLELVTMIQKTAPVASMQSAELISVEPTFIINS